MRKTLCLLQVALASCAPVVAVPVTGAGHARSMGVAADTVKWQGAPKVFEIQHEKSVVETAFCGKCGSPLYKRSTNLPKLTFIHVGSLDPESSRNWQPKMTV